MHCLFLSVHDAAYYYYRHGPMQRVELGQKVQGIDYAYTLQGWLKGINSTNVHQATDMGRDGINSNNVVARDVFGFALHYYSNADYQPLNDTKKPFADAATALASNFNPLFNGNIAAISMNIKIPGSPAV